MRFDLIIRFENPKDDTQIIIYFRFNEQPGFDFLDYTDQDSQLYNFNRDPGYWTTDAPSICREGHVMLSSMTCTCK